MEKRRIEALQDLIVRLEDAHKGYIEVKNAISDLNLINWMEQYAFERKKFQIELQKYLYKIGGTSQIKTSFLGDLHRMFIAFKLNNISEDPDSIINEIERGASQIISDYNKVIAKVDFPEEIFIKLKIQRDLIVDELNSLLKLKEQMKSEEFVS